MKLGTETASLTNHLMSKINQPPVVGKGATRLLWTDRCAYEVLEVDTKTKTCLLDRYDAERTDDNGMSDSQSYRYENLIGSKVKLYFRYGAWRERIETIEFINDEMANLPLSKKKELGVYGKDGDLILPELIPGVTKIKVTWAKWNVIFGVKSEYYDHQF